MKPKYNLQASERLILYPGKTGFVAQRLLRMSKDLNGLQTALGQNRGLRLGSFFSLMALRPNASYGLLIHEVSRSLTTTHHSR